MKKTPLSLLREIILTRAEKYLERWFPTLGSKIALAIAVVSIIAISIFFTFAQRTGFSVLQKDARAKALGIATLFRGILEQSMMDNDWSEMERTMRAAASSPEVDEALLLRTDGSVLLNFRDHPVEVPFPMDRFTIPEDPTQPRYASMRERDTLYEYVLLPIENKPGCVSCHANAPPIHGFIAMKIEVSNVQKIAREHRATNIIMTVLTFVGLGWITFIALSILVIKPLGTLHSHIRNIDQQVKQLARGEHPTFPQLPEPGRKDEIADLTRDFNALVARLNEANKKIFELHQAQLEHADRLKSTGEMAAGLAHEIKNPIAGVIGALQVFESDIPAGDPRREILTEMLIQLDRVNHTITDLLQYARPTPPVLEPVKINDLLQKTITLLSQQVKNRSVRIESSLSGNGIEILADRKQLQQVVWNLMLNGLQAMEGGGTLVVRSVVESDAFAITISDTGKGILPEHLDRIFKPFFTTKHKGTGLGMTISKRIIEQHRGTITVLSEVGRGTSVNISIPYQQTGDR